MGPRLFGRGNTNTAWMDEERWQRFNGATPFRTWKPIIHRRPRTKITLLQWGHAFSDVETLEFSRVKRRRYPLQWGHAFSDVETISNGARWYCPDVLLQWGHAFSDVETSASAVTGPFGVKLQWGHAFSDVETTQSRCGYALFQCFNGATPFRTWKQRIETETCAGKRCGFNGATPFRTWKREYLGQRARQRRASMGPRLFGRGNLSIARTSPSSSNTASMGLRLFGRGNSDRCRTRALAR